MGSSRQSGNKQETGTERVQFRQKDGQRGNDVRQTETCVSLSNDTVEVVRLT